MASGPKKTVFALMLIAALSSSAGPEPSRPGSQDRVELQMRNVRYRVDQSVVLEIRALRGEMIATRQGEIVNLDDRTSFITHVFSAEIAITDSGLSDLMNRYVFSDSDSPIRNVTITTDGKSLKQKGTMHKGVDLPFELEGSASATEDGNIRIHPEKIRSAHIPFKGILHLFGEDLSKLINLKQDRGVTIVGDDIILRPGRIVPPPKLEGKVTGIRLENGRIVQFYGARDAAKPLSPPHNARAYIYHRGGVLRFGKLTMADADLEIVDQAQKPFFDFNLSDYSRQLVAGYSKTTPSHGLVVFMPGYAVLAKGKVQK